MLKGNAACLLTHSLPFTKSSSKKKNSKLTMQPHELFQEWEFFWLRFWILYYCFIKNLYLNRTNNEIVQNSKSESKIFSFLCTFMYGVLNLWSLFLNFWMLDFPVFFPVSVNSFLIYSLFQFHDFPLLVFMFTSFFFWVSWAIVKHLLFIKQQIFGAPCKISIFFLRQELDIDSAYFNTICFAKWTNE